MAYYNPYRRLAEGGGKWLKCNFHVHNDIMPAEKKPQALINILKNYRAAGYDIIMNSEHHTYSDTSAAGAQAGIKTFNGQEYIEKDGIALVGTKGLITGRPQEAVDKCAADGGFSIVCHPNLNSGGGTNPHILSKDEMLNLKGISGVEVVTGCLLRLAGTKMDLGSGFAYDIWDEMLTKGMIVWAFGNDDYHSVPDTDNGWTAIYAKSDSFADVLESVREGCLYASSGPVLKRYEFDGEKIAVEAAYGKTACDMLGERVGEEEAAKRDKAEEAAQGEQEKFEYRLIGKGGRLLSVQYGTTAAFDVVPGEPYLRVEAYGGYSERLFTQPILAE